MSSPNSLSTNLNPEPIATGWEHMDDDHFQTSSDASENSSPTSDIPINSIPKNSESLPERGNFTNYVENLLESLATDGETVTITDEVINNTNGSEKISTMTNRLADKWEELVAAANTEIEQTKNLALEGTDFDISPDPNNLIIDTITRYYKPTNEQVIREFIIDNNDATAFEVNQPESEQDADYLKQLERNNIAFQEAKTMIQEQPNLTPEEALRAISNKYLLSEHDEDNAIGANAAKILDRYQEAYADAAQNIGRETAIHALEIYHKNQAAQQPTANTPALDSNVIS